jgi:heptosyltransferase-1
VSKILIVRLGALGDIVHAIPVAAALREAFPAARIDWLVSSKHADMLDLVTPIDRRIIVNDRRSAGEAAGSSVLAAVGRLRRERYDIALDLQGLVKSAMIARASGAARVVGFVGGYCREPLARWFYTALHDPGGAGIYAPSETRHIVHINLGILRELGVTAGPPSFPIAAVS